MYTRGAAAAASRMQTLQTCEKEKGQGARRAGSVCVRELKLWIRVLGPQHKDSKHTFLQKKDCIELLNGRPNCDEGKVREDVCCFPHVWALVFAQKNVYWPELGHSDPCGRLRFVVPTLDTPQVRATQFEEKMAPRRHSMDMTKGIH